MKYFGALFCLIGFIALKGGMGSSSSSSAFNFRTIAEDLWLSVILIFIGLVLLMIGRSSTWFNQFSTQNNRDRNARRAFETDDFSGLSLFLRPFETDGGYVIQSNFEDDYATVGKKSLMRTIAEAVERTCPLVAVGDRGGLDFSFGATGQRVTDWQKKISRAIETAELIIIIPGTNEGVIWEVGEIIKQEALARTLFVMPPLFGNGCWNETTHEVNKQHKILLPEHTIYGAIFTFHSVKKLKSFRKIDDSFLASSFRAATLINEVLK